MKEKRPRVDYDALLKEFVSHNFEDFLAFSIPSLHQAADWSKDIEFLEQELINSLKGKFPVRGKLKKTDKLVKLHLRDGSPHLVFVHIEFQHKPETLFSRRMYEYRSLIALKYGIQDITAVAVFSGAPPPQSELAFYKTGWDSELLYRFVSIIAARQDEQALIKSQNPFALAMLAAKYAQDSLRNNELRFSLKAKVFELSIESKILPQKIMEVLIFVRDFMLLPSEMENLFEEQQQVLMQTKTKERVYSEGTKRFIKQMYTVFYGQSPEDMMEQARLQAEEAQQRTEEAQQRTEEAQQRTEEAQQRMQEAQQRIEEERQRVEEERRQTILKLHKLHGMAPEQIALVLNIQEEVVANLIHGE